MLHSKFSNDWAWSDLALLRVDEWAAPSLADAPLLSAPSPAVAWSGLDELDHLAGAAEGAAPCQGYSADLVLRSTPCAFLYALSPPNSAKLLLLILELQLVSNSEWPKMAEKD